MNNDLIDPYETVGEEVLRFYADLGIGYYLERIFPQAPDYVVMDLGHVMPDFYRELAEYHLPEEMIEAHRDEMIVGLTDYLTDDNDPYSAIDAYAGQFHEDYPGPMGDTLYHLAFRLGEAIYEEAMRFHLFYYNQATDGANMYHILDRWLDYTVVVLRKLTKIDLLE
jgi:hypothetical protein